MGKRTVIGVVLGAALIGAGAGLLGCDSGDTGSGGEPDSDSQFVDTDGSTGSIQLLLLDDPIGVGDTGRFRVEVRDVAGAAVPNVQVSCDSEAEIAIIEPTSGVEMTDDFGNMSGVVGCEAPGSFRLGCRLPIGGNKRKFVTVHCEGEIPSGFEGWPGAAGGGLGGGVADGFGDEEPSEGEVRITSIEFTDANETTTSLDIVANPDCDSKAATIDPEIFTDALVEFTVTNNSGQLVRFSRVEYTVSNGYGTGASVRSGAVSFIGEASVEAEGGQSSFQALFLDASGGGKRYAGASEVIPVTAAGFKNVKFTLFGVTDSGESVQLTASTAISVDNFDNC